MLFKYERTNMRLTALLVVMVALMVSGCATSIPQAENFPASKQKKAMALQHWGLIASDAANQTRLALERQAIAKDKPLYVADNATTEFSRAFRKYMIAGRMNAGFTVSAKKEGAIEVGYEAQVIKHATSSNPQALGYKPGMASAGVAGFWVLRDALRYGSTAGALAATGAAAGGYDAYHALNPGETGVEILISTSIIHEERYVMLNADAYYIEKDEAWLFEGCKGKSRRMCR